MSRKSHELAKKWKITIIGKFSTKNIIKKGNWRETLSNVKFLIALSANTDIFIGKRNKPSKVFLDLHIPLKDDFAMQCLSPPCSCDPF